jgi:hypothetical protein
MGKDRIIDKSIDPVRALATGNITIAQAQQMYNGFIPIGDYKGAAAILDIDKLVKQPLVDAEQKHILGVLDGREEDYDRQTITIPAATAILGSVAESLTVPPGDPWFLTAIESILPASGGANIISGNWYCSLWTDRAATPSPYGQPFHAAPVNFGAGGGTQFDEFSAPAVWWVITNKPTPIRLPAGTVLTFVAINNGAVAPGAVNAVFNIYGYIGKSLVD